MEKVQQITIINTLYTDYKAISDETIWQTSLFISDVRNLNAYQ